MKKRIRRGRINMPSGKNDYEFIQYYDVNDPEFLSE